MTISQKDIYLVDFSPKIGAEINKVRPAVVVSSNTIGKLPLKTIVPITNWSESFLNYPWMIRILPDDINCLSKQSAIDCFQIRNFSIQRFSKKIGTIDNKTFEKIQQTIIKTIS